MTSTDLICLDLVCLDLVGDGDELDLIADLQRAFQIDYGDGALPWETVGDIEAAIHPRFPPDDDARKCATAMAFYEVRAHLHRTFGAPARAAPANRLDSILPGPPRRILQALRRDLGHGVPHPDLRWSGSLGFALLLAALPLGVALGLTCGVGWAGAVLLAGGVVLIAADQGAYADLTLGDVARDIALLDFARFAAQGADRRPAAIWRVLTQIVARTAMVDPARVTRRTRLFAE